MKSKSIILFFLFLSAFAPSAYAADFGENDDYLGQVVDDYENDDNIAAIINTINNETLDCMELNFTSGIPIYEDFEVYDEVDPNNRVVVNSPVKSTVTGLRRGDGTTYLREDYGAAYFDLDFEYTWVFEITDAEAGDGDSRTWLRLWAVTVAGLPTDAGARIMLNLDQIGADDTLFRLELYIRNGVGGADSDFSVNLDVATPYYMSVDRNGDNVVVEIRTGSLEGPLVDTLTTSFVNYLDEFRFIYFPMRKNSPVDVNDWISGTFEYLWNQSTSEGYALNGTYYTNNVLGGDPAIAILYNATIPSGTNMTMEFSTDNVTWVDHNNQAGYDILVDGYEALDLRDIYNGTITRRVNMTGDGLDTPRMYQARYVTVTTAPCNETFVNVTGAWRTFYFTSINTTIGTDTGGNFLNSTYDHFDGLMYNVTEVLGAPGLVIMFNISGLPNNMLCLELCNVFGYDGSAGHTFEIQVWNYTSSAWDLVVDIPDTSTGYAWTNGTLGCNYDDYVQGGLLQGRYYHPSPGNVNHDFFIDCGWLRAFVPYPVTATGPSLFPGLAIGIALLIIGAIYALEKRR